MSAVCASLWSDFGRCEQDSVETAEREDAAAVREEVICQNFHWEFSWKRLRWKILHQALMRCQIFARSPPLSQHQRFYFCHLDFVKSNTESTARWQKHSVNLILIGQSRRETRLWYENVRKFDSTLFTFKLFFSPRILLSGLLEGPKLLSRQRSKVVYNWRGANYLTEIIMVRVKIHSKP